MTQAMQVRGPGKKGLWIGAILIVVGVLGGIGLVAYGARTLVNTINGYQRVRALTGGTISLSDGRHDVYYERPGLQRRGDIPPVEVVLVGQGRRITLDVSHSNTTEHYDFNDHEGVRFTRFNVPAQGVYRVSVVGEGGVLAGDEIAFGKGSITEGILGLVGGVLGGGLFVLIGVIVLITTVVRRTRFRRRMAGGGYPGGYGPPGGWSPAAPVDPAAPWHMPSGQPGPSGRPPGWAPPPPAAPGGPPGPSAQPGGWPPAAPPASQPPASAPPPASSAPPTPPASKPTNDPDRPGWGAPGQ